MVLRRFSMSPTDLTENSNKVKEIFLDAMVKEKILTEEQQKLMNSYCFVLCEKNWLGKFWNKLWNKDDPEAVNIIIVKVLDCNN